VADIPVDSNLDFKKVVQIKGAIVEPVATSAALTAKAQLAYVEADNHLYSHDGATPKRLAWASDLVSIQSGTAYPTAPPSDPTRTWMYRLTDKITCIALWDVATQAWLPIGSSIWNQALDTGAYIDGQSIKFTIGGVTGGFIDNSGGQSIGYLAGTSSANSSNCTNNGYAAGASSANSSNCTNNGLYAGYLSANSPNCTNNGYAAGASSANSSNCTNNGLYAGASSANSSNCTNNGLYAGYLSANSSNCTNNGLYAGYLSANSPNCTNNGYAAGYLSANSPNCTNNGYAAGLYLNYSDYTIAPASVNVGTQNITVTGHTFGSIGDKFSIEIISGSPPAPYGVTGTYLFEVVDPSTIKPTSPTAAFTTTGATFAIRVRARASNAIALGYQAITTKSNQAIVGNSALTELKTFAPSIIWGQLPAFATHSAADAGVESGQAYKLTGDRAVYQRGTGSSTNDTIAPTSAITVPGLTSATLGTFTISGLLSTDMFLQSLAYLLPVSVSLSSKIISATQVRVDVHNCEPTALPGVVIPASTITLRRIS
jgi:hypothetical protein